MVAYRDVLLVVLTSSMSQAAIPIDPPFAFRNWVCVYVCLDACMSVIRGWVCMGWSYVLEGVAFGNFEWATSLGSLRLVVCIA